MSFNEQVCIYERENLNINPLSPDGSFMGQKIAISPPIPIFKGLKILLWLCEDKPVHSIC